MNLQHIRNVSWILLATLLSAGIQAQTAANIPDSVSGTYNLSYAFASSGSPFTNGTAKTFVLNGSTDTMCVDGVSLGAGYTRSGSSELFWNGGNGVYFALSLRDGGTNFNEINVYSPSDAGTDWKGQFTGSRSSTSTTCAGGSSSTTGTFTSDQQGVISIAAGLYPDLFTGGGDVKSAQGYTYQTFASGVTVGFKDGTVYVAGGPFGSSVQSKGAISAVQNSLQALKNSVTITPTADMTSVFNLAHQLYPSLFAGSTASLQTSADGFLYRYNAASGVYAAIKDGVVYVKGGSYGNAYTSVGALNAVLNQLQTAINGGNNPGGGTTIPQGNFNLTVSGTVAIAGPFSVSVPFSYSINGIPAPDTSDQEDIEEAFVDALNTSGVTINSFSYTVVENSANRVEFSMSVSATVSGVTSNYVLNYLYTK